MVKGNCEIKYFNNYEYIKYTAGKTMIVRLNNNKTQIYTAFKKYFLKTIISKG